MVICDESHNLKSKDAKRTIMALPFLRNASIALCLTGTPATNRPEELFTQLNGIRPEIFNDYDQFTLRYCDAKIGRFGREVRGSSNETELKLLLEGVVMIRRLKADVVRNLPVKSRIVRYVTPDPTQLEELKLKQKESRILETALRDPSISTAVSKQLKTQQQVLLNMQYMITGLSKIQGVLEEVRRLVDEARLERAIAEEKDDNIKILNMETGGEYGIREDCDNLLDVVDDIPSHKISPDMEYVAAPVHVDAKGDSSHDMKHQLNTSRSVRMDIGEYPSADIKVNPNQAFSSPTHVIENEKNEIEVNDNKLNIISTSMESNDIMNATHHNINPCSDNICKISSPLVDCGTRNEHANNTESEGSDDDLVDTDDSSDSDYNSTVDNDKMPQDVMTRIRKRVQRVSDRHRVHRSRRLEEVESEDDSSADASRAIAQDDITIDDEVDMNDDVGDDIFFLDRKPSKSRRDATVHKSNENPVETWRSLLPGKTTSKSNENNHSKVEIRKRKSSKKSNKECDNVFMEASMPVVRYRGLGRKILVFAHHVAVLDALENCLHALQVKYVRIDGQVTAALRGDLIQRFQKDDEVCGMHSADSQNVYTSMGVREILIPL